MHLVICSFFFDSKRLRVNSIKAASEQHRPSLLCIVDSVLYICHLHKLYYTSMDICTYIHTYTSVPFFAILLFMS
ncbi:hypothetical protein L6452_04099 [Arctium lappa]|uniref:Uncharacterized protein n=1 Tax=Arctium lappa TaxID=4217 RepID=A0ACB9FP42_ARCLA|nr:hypothetical protein L6452_04099 [Arctium lappa]